MFFGVFSYAFSAAWVIILWLWMMN